MNTGGLYIVSVLLQINPKEMAMLCHWQNTYTLCTLSCDCVVTDKPKGDGDVVSLPEHIHTVHNIEL